MPLYLIRRPFPGASKSDLAAAGYRALACAPFYPGMRWLRSYWDDAAGVTLCIYEARSIEDIRRHAVQSELPCDDIQLVEEMIPDEVPEPV